MVLQMYFAETTSLIGQFNFPIAYNLLATYLFGLTGALVAMKRGYDLIGVGVLAFVVGAGGGLLRDGMFLQDGPVLFLQNPGFIVAIFFAILTGLLVPKIASKFNGLFFVADALGLGIYAVIGAQMTINRGLSVYAAIIVGFTSAIGGGLLRDILIKKEPALLLPGQYYAISALVGIFLFLALGLGFGVNAQVSAVLAISATFLIRFASVRFDMRSKPVSDFAGIGDVGATKLIHGVKKELGHIKGKR